MFQSMPAAKASAWPSIITLQFFNGNRLFMLIHETMHQTIHLHHMSLSNREYHRMENQKDWASGQTASALSDEG